MKENDIYNEASYDSFFLKAEELRLDHRFEEAAEVYHSLLNYRLNADHLDLTKLSGYDLLIIERLSDISQLIGDTESSHSFLSGLIALYGNNKQIFLFCYSVLKKADLYVQSGQLDKAEQILVARLNPYLDNIESVLYQSGKFTTCEIHPVHVLNDEERTLIHVQFHYVSGSLFSAYGHYKAAMAAIDSGIYQGAVAKVSMSVYSLVLIEKARILIEMGSLNRAAVVLQELKKMKSGLTVSSGTLAGYYELQSRFYMMRGEYGLALEVFQRLLQLAEACQLYRTIIIVRCNIAGFQLLLNQLSEAVLHLSEASNLCEIHQITDLQPRVYQLRQLIKLKGQISLGEHRFNVTTPFREIKEVSAIRGEIKLEAITTNSYLVRFENAALGLQLLLHQGEPEEVSRYMERLQQEYGQSDSRLIQEKLLILKMTCVYRGNLNISASYYRQSIRFLESEQLYPDLYVFQNTLIRHLSETSVIKRQLLKSNERLIHRLRSSLSGDAQAVFMLNKWTAEETFLSNKIFQILLLGEISRRGGIKQRWYQLQIYKRLTSIQTYIDIYKDIRSGSVVKGEQAGEVPWIQGSYFSMFYRTLKQPKDRITISYLVLPDRVLIGYYGFMKTGFKVTFVDRVILRDCIKKMYRLIHQLKGARGLGRNPENKGELSFGLQAILQQVAELLQLKEILRQLPKRVRRISFLPDDSLHSFPFALLPYKDSFLLSSYAITIAYKYSEARLTRGSVSRKGVVVAGVSRHEASYTDIPGVEKEIHSIRKKFEGRVNETLLNDGCSKANLLKAVSSARVLHLASHGFFRYEAPDRSGVILSKGEIISLKDILRSTAFRGLQHVTLSSCLGAEHFVLPGRWVISLPETLHRSGVDSTLGCLWDVHDEFATAFMGRYYFYLEQHPRDISLQKAQLDAINKELSFKAYKNHELLWAGFQLYGSWRKLAI